MMALSRLALKKIVSTMSTSVLLHKQPQPQQYLVPRRLQFAPNWNTSISRSSIPKLFATSSSSSDNKSSEGVINVDNKDITETPKGKKSKWLPLKFGRRGGGGLWRRNKNRSASLVPFHLNDLFSAGVGDVLLQATDNLNKLFENWAPSGLIGLMKENESRYKLRYELPGLTKEDVKITVEDDFLTIKGEHKEEEEECDEDDHEHWSASRYGYYETSFMLPDDAKVEEIKAEMKGGVLSITIPRTEKANAKDVKEIEIT
ncbi:hypothetical protein MKX01_024504 [Papaver californicum]|nr:hypothetical protein MKX01_024504 [Papaver californicum]